MSLLRRCRVCRTRNRLRTKGEPAGTALRFKCAKCGAPDNLAIIPGVAARDDVMRKLEEVEDMWHDFVMKHGIPGARDA